MSRTKAANKRKRKDSESKKKGNLVEDVVALLHENQGVKVGKRIRLPTLKHGTKRKREIDVLLTTEAAGYPVRLAIECKNEGKSIGTGRIDEFIAKLQDVGIPVSHGIYVSLAGYTSDALAYAISTGIRPLKLEGLTPDRLNASISEALQSVVYLTATWSQISRFDNVEHESSGGPWIQTTLSRGLGFGTAAILTHLWLLWVNDIIPPLIGTHHIYIRLPETFYFEGDEAPFRNGIAIATLEVSGEVATFRGRVKRLELRHAKTSELEKLRFEAEFDDGPERVQLASFRSEEELGKFLEAHPIRLPAETQGAAHN